MTITAPSEEGTITLDGGRRLGYACFGPSDGRPVLWFHGTPGARRQIPEPARVAAHELGVRIVGFDRPGVGSSTPYLFASLLAATSDVERLADHLGFGRFGAIGLSGGGPYVLAAAHALPDRMVAGIVLGGVAPTQGEDAAPGGAVGLLARFGPLLTALRLPLSLALATFVWSTRPVASPVFDLYARFLSPPGDRDLLNRPEMKAMFLDDLLLGGRPGLRAPVYDLILFSRHWGFSLSEVTTPIHWLHGDADHLVPLSHAEHVVSLLPDATLAVRPGESHLGSLAAAEQILGTILGHWDQPASVRGRRGGS